MFNRRLFIKKTALGIMGAGIGRNEHIPLPQRTSSKGMAYRRFGRTGFLVSDIGTGDPYSDAVLKATLNAGINFIETSEGYGNGRSEERIGRVIKNFNREKIFIATKASPNYKLFKSAQDVIERANASLNRLQTDYIDLYMIHQAQNIFRVKDDFFHRACDQLKREGKIRFVGLSCHGQPYWQDPRESLEHIMMEAIQDGRFDGLFFPYNFMEPDMGNRIINACKEKDIGTMIMKSNPVLMYEDYLEMLGNGQELSRTEEREYEKLQLKFDVFFNKYRMNGIEEMKDGAIQFILTNPDAHTICCRFENFSDVEKYARLSGTILSDRLSGMLKEFKNDLGFMNCRIGCHQCEGACPHHLPVGTIWRYLYYFKSKKREKYAMQEYHKIPGRKAGTCVDCPGFCVEACPHGVAVQSLMRAAHQTLTPDGTHFA